jgi:hypothetical protein
MAALADVPPARLLRLHHAVNVTRWFWLPEGGGGAQHFQSYLGDAELAALRTAGAGAVRLVVAPSLFLQRERPSEPKADIAFLDAAIDRILAQDLAVVLELQDDDKSAWEERPGYVATVMAFWGALAARYRDRDANRLFFEVVNEPRFAKRGNDWRAIQATWVRTMRAVVPEHTLVLTGNEWGGVEGLLALPPEADPNVVYSFHFYEPFTFTHQGATWADPALALLAKVPYPARGAACEAAVAEAKTEAAKGTVRQYCVEGWSKGRVEERLRAVATWATRHRVHVWMGEFGAYCKSAIPAERIAWIRDTAAAADALGIGWALWGYDDCFGLGRRKDGERVVLDRAVADAVGFRFPSP